MIKLFSHFSSLLFKLSNFLFFRDDISFQFFNFVIKHKFEFLQLLIFSFEIINFMFFVWYCVISFLNLNLHWFFLICKFINFLRKFQNSIRVPFDGLLGLLDCGFLLLMLFALQRQITFALFVLILDRLDLLGVILSDDF